MSQQEKGSGMRLNEGKVRTDLIPHRAVTEMAKVMTKGAEKYAPNNWMSGMAWSKCVASLKRHLAAFERGEDYDPETGLLHVSHLMTNAAFLVEYYRLYPEGDDRQHFYLRPRKIGLDIDEVICDFTLGWSKLHGVERNPENWNYHRQMGQKFEQMKKKNTLNNFYLSLQPKVVPSEIPFEPHCYVTSRPIASKVTEQWLDKHKFPGAPVITVGVNQSKVEAIKKAGVEIFVDDRYENFVELNNAGICCYLLDAPHNKRYEVGYKRIYSLKDLM